MSTGICLFLKQHITMPLAGLSICPSGSGNLQFRGFMKSDRKSVFTMNWQGMYKNLQLPALSVHEP